LFLAQRSGEEVHFVSGRREVLSRARVDVLEQEDATYAHKRLHDPFSGTRDVSQTSDMCNAPRGPSTRWSNIPNASSPPGGAHLDDGAPATPQGSCRVEERST